MMIPKYFVKYMFFGMVFIYGGITLNMLSWISNNNPIIVKKQQNTMQTIPNSMENDDIARMGVEHFEQNKRIFENKQKRQRKILANLIHAYHDNHVSPNSKMFGFLTVGNISVFSAFYDDRISLDQDAPVIRIIGISQLDGNENLICRYSSLGKDSWILAMKSEMTENHGKQYGGFMYLCNIPQASENIPRKIYIASLSDLSKKQDNDVPQTSLDILRITKPAHPQTSKQMDVTDTNDKSRWKDRNSTHSSENPSANANNLLDKARRNIYLDLLSLNGKVDVKNRPNLQEGIKNRLRNIDHNINSIIRGINDRNRSVDDTAIIAKTDSNKFKQINFSNISANAESTLININKQFKVKSNTTDQSIAVCVPPLHGNIKLSNFIQFVEILKIQGVSHLIFYDMNVTSDLNHILTFYERSGIVTRFPWTLPPGVDGQIWYHGQVIAIQDCLYRTMGNYNYVAFMDLDELIIPKLDFDWLAMLHRLQTSSISDHSKSVAFSFKTSLFNPDFVQDDSPYHIPKQSKLSFLKNVQRNVNVDSLRTKLIVRPEYIVEMGIHHVSQTLNQSQNPASQDVNASVALMHHYRTCIPHGEDGIKCGPKQIDDTILKYETLLNKQYGDVIKQTWKLFKTV